MSHADFAVNFFVALFALVDPVGLVPMFAAATAGTPGRERAQIAAYVALFVFGFATFFYFSGVALLAFFGISLPAFRIAGGVILFLMGLEMTRDDFTVQFAEAAGPAGPPRARRGYALRRFEQLLVPFAMPLLIGPGAISTVVIYASQARALGLAGAAIGVAVIAAVSVCTFAAFMATGVISRILGRIGLTIVVRVLGLILCAMAAQFILGGVADATHGLVLPQAAAPYGG
jgi:multiple antibiotic resistance protein